ncbi:MAG TPA: RNA methyltransferase [Turneriella sp.]|nr:RNA methyltransferase [Turneriella sp.]
MSNDYLTDRRRARIANVLENRTRRVTVLLEDIYDPLNANAVLRTCDGLGIQDIHVAENRHKFTVHSKVSGHTAHWLTLHRYRTHSLPAKTDFRIKPEGVQPSTEKAYKHLKDAGYIILATSPRGTPTPLDNLDTTKKYVVALGSEHWGLSDYAIENGDKTIALPMLGFTESYNISVTAAMILFYLTKRLTGERGLTEHEKNQLWQQWGARGAKPLEPT